MNRLHPAWIILRAVATLRAMAVPLVIFLFSGGSRGELFGFGIAVAVIVGTIVTRALGWWRFTYAVTPQGVRVQSGLLSRQDRLMPYERIQSVDLREGVLERLLRVTQVRIESAAGGGDADIVLGAVGRARAAELRTLLQQHGAAAPVTVDATGRPTPAVSAEGAVGELIYAASMGRLLLAGATSSRVGPALAIFAGIAQFADEILRDSWWDWVVDAVPRPTLALIVVVVIAALLFSWLLAIATTVLTFGGFQLRRDGDRLLISHGLLERRRSTIPLARIQAVTVSEGWLRQPFGLAAVRVESAGYGKTSAESGVLAPIIPRRELPSLLARACPAYLMPTEARFAPLPGRAERRYLLSNAWFVLIVGAVATVAAALLPWAAWWWGSLVFLALPVALFYGYLEFRDTGWSLDVAGEPGRIAFRSREVDRVTAVTRRSRLQERSVSQHPLQRRAGLATFHAAVAAGGGGKRVTVTHLDAGEAFDLLDRLSPPPPSPAGTPDPLTTIRRDHDDSSPEFRPFIMRDEPDRDRPMPFEPPTRSTQ